MATIRMFVGHQLLLTIFLVVLLWSLYAQLRKQDFFRWWAWAWTSFAGYLAIGALALQLAPAWTLLKGSLVLASLVCGFLQIPLLAFGACALRGKGKPSRVWIRAGIVVAVVVSALIFAAALYCKEKPFTSFAVRTLPRTLALTASLFFCTWVFVGQWRGNRSLAAVITGGFCSLYALDQTLYSLIYINQLVSGLAAQIPPLSFKLLLNPLPLFLDSVFEFGICLGIVLLLVEEHRRTEFALLNSNEHADMIAETNVALQAEIAVRKRAEAALRETEDRYRDLVENSQDLLCTHDLAGKMLSCNPAPAQILGYTVEEILHTPMRDFLAPEYRDAFDEYLTRVRKDGMAEGLMVVISRTGERRVWEYRNTLRTEGVPVPIVRGMAHDITERLRAEKALRESEEKYRGLFERMSSGVAVYRAIGDGEDFVFVEFNHAAEEIEHIGRQSVIGKRVTEAFPGVKEFGIFSVFQRVLRTGKPEYVAPALYRDERDPGTWRESWVYRLAGREIVAVYNDVTERKRAEAAQAWLASFPKLNPNPVVEADVTGRVLYLNPAAERLFPDMESRGVAHPWLAGLEDVERTCRTSASSECLREVLVDGAWYYQVTHLVPSTQKLRLYGFDITDHKRAEAALRESEARLRLSIQSANIGLWDWNLVTNEVYFSREWKIQIGCAEDEIPNRFEEWQSRVHPDDLEPTLQKVRASIASPQGRHEVEFRFRHKDGSYRWIRAQADVLRDAAGKPVRMLGCHLDITERVEQQNALRESEARLIEAQHNAHIGSWRYLPDGTVSVSDEMYELLRLPRDAPVTYETILSAFQPDDQARIPSHFQEALASCALDFQSEYQVIWPDGSVRNLFSLAVIHRDREGRVIEVVGTTQDVTERKQAEAALQASKQQLQNILDTMYAFVGLFTLDGVCVVSNRSGYEAAGLQREDVVGRPFAETYFWNHSPAVQEQIREALRRAAQGETVRDDFASRSAGGKIITVDGTFGPVRDASGRVTYVVASGVDVTERKRAEERLREYEKVVEGVEEMIAVVDREYRYAIANHAFLKYRGLTSGELIGRRIPDVLSSGVFEKVVKAKLDECFQGRVVKYEMNYAYPRLGERDLFISYFPIEGPAGVDRVACVLQDVTERKRAEHALRASEEKYREMVENASFGIFRSTLDGQLLDVNPALVAMLGYGSKEELMMHSLKADIYEDPSERTSILARYETSERVNNVDTKWKRKDGNLITVRMSGRGVRGEDGRISHFEVIVEDVTGLRVLEDELRKAQKMEAVGRLAGGVAHDFNNILTAIQMNGSLLAGGLVPPDRLQEKARDILASADRGAALTRQLLAFGRKQVLEPRILDLNEMLRGLSSLIRGIIPENVSVTASLCNSVGLVKADPHQLEHVIINLVNNARDAMPNGGQLIIETSNVDASGHSAATARILPPGQYVVFAVSDTGIGMDPATQACIFDPFFTTRRNEGGTGLGLATSYGTVKQSGGYIFVYSAKGQGTTFKIFLPIADPQPKAVETAAEPNSIRGRGETILLVEDEDLVRKSTAEFLSAYGYVVLEARNGPEALQLAMSHSFDIAAVVTDMIMPGIDGREVVEILRQLRPQLRAVLMSGYTERKVVEKKEAVSFTFLQKPFTAEVLANTLRRVLDGNGVVNII